MKFPAIPVINPGDPELAQFATSVKETLDAITAQQRNAATLAPLASTATTADIINRLNALLARIQG